MGSREAVRVVGTSRGIALLVCAAAGAVGVASCGATKRARPQTLTQASTAAPSTAAAPREPPPRPRKHPAPAHALAERTLVLIDHSRAVRVPGGGSQPRRLVTIIRYPANGRGPYPLIVFGHGFAVTPAPYSALLEAWARAGYVVAAPIFPLENADAPGGPDESDLVNQPRDMSFVISRLLALSARHGNFLSGAIDGHEVAVAGQSDGGETALAVAYDRYFLDRRIGAAVILSGAKIPGLGGFDFPAPSPPLLATQGTADTINPPAFTSAFFDVAPPPKYLLQLFGAPHLGPYTTEQPQLGIVERVTIAFFDRYLKGAAAALRRMTTAGDVSGVSRLSAAG